MKRFLLVILVLSSFSSMAATKKGRVYVNSFAGSGQKIIIKGRAAKLLFNDLAATHSSDGLYTQVRQSNTIVCLKDNKKVKCIIKVDPQTGEVVQQPLHQALFEQ